MNGKVEDLRLSIEKTNWRECVFFKALEERARLVFV